MPELDLGWTQTRLLTCTAIMAAGTLVSGALGGMAAGVMGGMVANDLGELAKRKQSIQQKLAKSQTLQNWIAVGNLRDKEFIDQLAEKSEYNFMYLRYVLPDIETGKYQNLDIKSLPSGLNQYYRQHWQRMGMNADGLPQIKIDTIYVLVKLGEPVSAELIADIVGESKPKVRRILRECEQFLRQEEKDGQICYSVYHASFRDFLLRQETLEEANVSLKDIEDRIINNLRQGL